MSGFQIIFINSGLLGAIKGRELGNQNLFSLFVLQVKDTVVSCSAIHCQILLAVDFGKQNLFVKLPSPASRPVAFMLMTD